MIVLVDYDNLPVLDTRRGLTHVVDKLLNAIGAKALSPHPRVRLRLYGGWYERSRLTRRAQDLTAATGVYPKRVTVVNGTDTVNLIAQVSLALSMEIDPRTNLENTFRARSIPEGLHCDSPPYTSCVNASACPLASVYDIVERGICPDSTCRVVSADIMGKAEQKLVDTMLTADMIYLASNGSHDLCVVSSDDDLWPAIKSALILSARVFHIHTIAGRSTPTAYSRGAGANYTQLPLR
jgi:hypothetical protein